jgi:hypothetical protein
MSKIEFLAVLMETTTAIRCGHTGVQPDAETQAAFAAAPLFPLRIMIEKRRLFVLANDTSNDSTIRPGMEILEINGRTSREIFDRIMPAISTDGISKPENGEDWRPVSIGAAGVDEQLDPALKLVAQDAR